MTRIEKPVVLLGASGHAKVVIATLRAAGVNVLASYDDDSAKWGSAILGVPVVGPLSDAREVGHACAIISIGSNQVRRDVSARLTGLSWSNAIHPSAVVDRMASVAEGTVIFASVVVQPDAAIGQHVILNTAATVDHDCVVEDFAHLAPGVHLAGGVRVGQGALVGIGTVVVPGITIGAWATVGAGSVVIRNVPPKAVVAGVPARLIPAVDNKSR